MKNITSILGWLLLVTVLAVPSFLFYNWLSKSKQQNQAELVHEPIAGSVFPADKSSSQTPVAQQNAAAPLRQDVKAVDPAPAATAARPASAPAPDPAPAAKPPAEQPPSASANAPAPGPAAAQPAAVSTAVQQGSGPQDQVATSTGPKLISYYNPKSTRDPTFSPDDYKRIREDEQRREQAERDAKDAEARVRSVREPGPETRISLQGIVGNAAIVNGEMYTVGKTVRGVKILKIGADYIIAEYKGRKFKKILK